MTDDIPRITFGGGNITFTGPNHFIDRMNDYLPGYKYNKDIREVLALLNYRGYHFETARETTVFSGVMVGDDFIITHVTVGDTVIPEDHFDHINIPELGVFTAVVSEEDE